MTYSELTASLAPEIVLSEDMIGQIRKYLSLLKEWNEKMNLTSITEEEDALEKHIYDSLLPAKSPMFKGETIADVGTGAGFPGLVYAIAFPKKKIVLVEATGKKCQFLAVVVSELKLTNVTILNKRAEEMKERDHFDMVVARAVASLPILLEITAPFAKVHGLVLALKGDKAESELAISNRAEKILSLKLIDKQVASLPLSKETRVNLFFQKEEKTLRRYPRAYAEILKKPL